MSPLTLGDRPLAVNHLSPGITGRSRIDEAFNRKGVMPDIVLSAQFPMSSRPTSSWGWASGWLPSSPGMPASGHLYAQLDTAICLMPIPCGWDWARGQLQRNYVWRFIECAMPDCRWMRSSVGDGAGRGRYRLSDLKCVVSGSPGERKCRYNSHTRVATEEGKMTMWRVNYLFWR